MKNPISPRIFTLWFIFSTALALYAQNYSDAQIALIKNEFNTLSHKKSPTADDINRMQELTDIMQGISIRTHNYWQKRTQKAQEESGITATQVSSTIDAKEDEIKRTENPEKKENPTPIHSTPKTKPLMTAEKIGTVSFGAAWRQGRRSTMEDTLLIKYLNYNAQILAADKKTVLPEPDQASKDAISEFANRQITFAGVYDGHGGSSVAEKLGDQETGLISVLITTYAVLLENEMKKRHDEIKAGKSWDISHISFTSPWLTLIPKIFADFDEKYFKKSSAGSTAAITIINPNGSFVAAHCGDSRIIQASKDGVLKWESIDHKPESPQEQERLNKIAPDLTLKLGGITRLAVGNHLSVSRSFGDSTSKNITIEGKPGTHNVVSVEPDIHIGQLEDGDYLVICCDGVYEPKDISSKQVAKLVAEKPLKAALKEEQEDKLEPGEEGALAAQAHTIRDEAYNKGSRDNISVVVLQYSTAK